MRIKAIIAALMLMAVTAAGTVGVYANVPPDIEETEVPAPEGPEPAEEVQEEEAPAEAEVLVPAGDTTEAVEVPVVPGKPLTPDGNMGLVDDVGDTTAAGKQFITMITKNGNYFYVIIDRDDNGKENVHFLNQVDEEDLLRLMDEEEADAIREQLAAQKITPTPKPTVVVKQPTETPKPEEKKPVNVLPLLGPLLLVLGGGGAFAFYSFRKKKKAETVTVDPDADYQEEEYDFSEAFEDEEEDPENDGYDDDDEM